MKNYYWSVKPGNVLDLNTGAAVTNSWSGDGTTYGDSKKWYLTLLEAVIDIDNEQNFGEVEMETCADLAIVLFHSMWFEPSVPPSPMYEGCLSVPEKKEHINIYEAPAHTFPSVDDYFKLMKRDTRKRIEVVTNEDLKDSSWFSFKEGKKEICRLNVMDTWLSAISKAK